MRLSTLARDHLPAIHALLLRACPTRVTDRASLERTLFASPGIFAAQRAWGLWRGGSLRAIVAACVASNGRGFVQLLAVDPEARRAGLGASLLDHAEGWLRARGARRIAIEGSAPAYWRPGLEFEQGELSAFLSRRGYREVDRHRSLRVGLPRLVELDHAVAVQHHTLGDPRSPFAAIAAAFGAVWATEAWLAASARPPHSAALLLAHDHDGALIGFAASGVGGPDVFGPTGVWPAARGRGVGRALLLAALDDIRARGCGEALISWLGPENYYRRALAGWTLTAQDYRVFERELAR